MVTRNRISWFGIPSHATPERGLQLAILADGRNIEAYTFGNIGEVSPDEASKSTKRFTDRKISPDQDEKPRTSRDYFFMFQHKHETFKFYPLRRSEVSGLSNAMLKLTQNEPTSENEYVRKALANHLRIHREKILTHMLKEDDPWIRSSKDLSKVVSDLLKEHKPQRLVDIERLYHSCRLEQEVTSEAFGLLKASWIEAKSDQVRIKVG